MITIIKIQLIKRSIVYQSKLPIKKTTPIIMVDPNSLVHIDKVVFCGPIMSLPMLPCVVVLIN